MNKHRKLIAWILIMIPPGIVLGIAFILSKSLFENLCALGIFSLWSILLAVFGGNPFIPALDFDGTEIQKGIN